MKTFTSVVVAFGLLTSLVSAHTFDKRWDNGTAVTVVTDVVTSFTTYCPAATTFAINNSTYTVSSATTLTITNCPCTLTSTVPVSSGVAGATGGAGGALTSTTVVGGGGVSTKAGSTPTGTGAAAATGAAVAFGPEVGLLALGAAAVAVLF